MAKIQQLNLFTAGDSEIPDAPDSSTPWTAEQRDAIGTSGLNLLVSAGAGSGKTAVLAERCASLICGDDRTRGCGVDRFLVVTFTEAAAAEMKQRMASALRARLSAQPANAWIQRQLALLDTAAISTLHAFCLRVLRRHFADADLDPLAPILDDHESALLKRDTARQTLKQLLDDPRHNEPFLELTAAYGGNNDSQLLRVVESLNDFLSSLPDPEHWIAQVHDHFRIPAAATVLPEFWRRELLQSIQSELDEQRSACDAIFSEFSNPAFPIRRLLEWLSPYREALSAWSARLQQDPSENTLDALSQEFESFEIPSIPARSLVKNSSIAEQDEFMGLQARLQTMKDRYFKARLCGRFGKFSIADWLEGLRRTAPHVGALLDLAAGTQRGYTSAKRDLGVIDFADMERFMLDLLADGNNNVARLLRDQFEHVLVDEFQDISPIQARIIEHVSREKDASRPGNLFCVGDVKQSIYRFRLAEPRLFLERMQRYTAPTASSPQTPNEGQTIDLLENFRTRHSIIDAINSIFEKIMAADLGGIEYDAHARLKPGRRDEEAKRAIPVELCILEGARSGRSADDESDDEQDEDSEAHDWTQIEREAYAISCRIQKLVAEGTPHRDIVILLRAMQPRAASLIRALARLGIPAIADTAGGLFEALEIQSVLALLAVLDNPRQDIPLAAILRSPLLGTPLSDDDLVTIRANLPAVPFHEAIPAYAHRAKDGSLRQKLCAILDQLDAWRQQSRLLPLADLLWAIYEESGYFAYIHGLRDGPQRRANLVRLHEYARQFGTFQRQGLARFLEFIQGLQDADRDLDPGTISRTAEDAVRVMTVHRAKGLEFPVVIVAEVGKRFNFSDARQRIMFDRRLGLAMSAIDLDRYIWYRTLPRVLVADALASELLAEELRVLYVALTRARDRLILIGTGTKGHMSALDCPRNSNRPDGTLPLLERRTATCALDWIVAALIAQPLDPKQFEITLHGWQSMSEWHMDPPQRPEVDQQLESIARLDPLPSNERPADSQIIELVRRRLTTSYPATAFTRVPAVAAASTLKRRWETRQDAEDPAAALDNAPSKATGYSCFKGRRPDFLATTRIVEPNQRGTWTHEFLQRLDMSRLCDIPDLKSQLERFVHAGLFASEEAREIDLAAVAWFFATPWGLDLRDPATRIYREWPFVIGVEPSRYDPACGTPAAVSSPSDLLLVRGIVDCLYDRGDGWVIIDYKTDAVDAVTIQSRSAEYRAQLEIYDRAISATFPQPAIRRALVFLAARQVIEM